MPKKTYKLLLINPVNKRRQGLNLVQERIFPPMAYGIIGALTPPNWEVEILDENFTPYKYQEADFVAFTSLTATINRCYDIAKEYRANGVPTVIGGIHASMLPEEAAQYIDTVVVGEAEGVWQEIISDFEKGRLKKFYHAKLPSLVNSPLPRTDLYHPGYKFGSVQTTRGCPMNCDFCSVHAFNGSKYRLRPIDQALRDFANVKQDRIFLVDDNFVGYNQAARNHALEFFQAIINSGIKKDWFSAASMNIGGDDEILEAAAKSGCLMIYLGIESELVSQLEQMKKNANIRLGVEKYTSVYNAIHEHGISVMGAFIYGLDTDTPETIYDRTSYIIEEDIDMMQASILTPLPGTSLYNRLKEEGRLLYTDYPKDWERHGFFDLVFKPKLVSTKEMEDAIIENWERLYNPNALKKKFLRTLQLTKNPTAAVWGITSNLQMRNMVFEGIKPSLEPENAFPGLLSGIQLR